MKIRSIATWLRRLLVLLCLVIAGCGGSEGRNLSLDEDVARDSCKEFLETWKSGGKAAELEPDIIGKDQDWDAGHKLVNYEFLPNEMDGGSNLHIPVRLTLNKTQGGEVKLDVVYIVGTTPKVSVFRDAID